MSEKRGKMLYYREKPIRWRVVIRHLFTNKGEELFLNELGIILFFIVFFLPLVFSILYFFSNWWFNGMTLFGFALLVFYIRTLTLGIKSNNFEIFENGVCFIVIDNDILIEKYGFLSALGLLIKGAIFHKRIYELFEIFVPFDHVKRTMSIMGFPTTLRQRKRNKVLKEKQVVLELKQLCFEISKEYSAIYPSRIFHFFFNTPVEKKNTFKYLKVALKDEFFEKFDEFYDIKNFAYNIEIAKLVFSQKKYYLPWDYISYGNELKSFFLAKAILTLYYQFKTGEKLIPDSIDIHPDFYKLFAEKRIKIEHPLRDGYYEDVEISEIPKNTRTGFG